MARQRHAVEVGQRLRSLRLGLGLTQADFAKEVGTSPATLSRMETGDLDLREVRWRTVVAFADHLKVTSDFLMGRKQRSDLGAKVAPGWTSATARELMQQWKHAESEPVPSWSTLASLSAGNDVLHLVMLLRAIPEDVRTRVIEFIRFEMSRSGRI